MPGIFGYPDVDFGASGPISTITTSAPITTTGGATPNLAMHQADTSHNGFLASSDWNSFNSVTQATKRLFVDKNRTDSYTESGSFAKPFLTIQAAINQIATNADNSTYVYIIDIVGPGTYAENLTMNSANLISFIIDGHNSVSIAPASGLGLASTTNNDGLLQFVIYGCSISGGITLTGASDATNFLSGTAQITNSVISGAVTITNTKFINFVDCTINNAVTFTNVQVAIISGGNGTAPASAMTIVTNSGANKPSGFSTTQILVEKTIAGSDVTIGAGSLYQTREGTRVGYPGGSITVNGSYQCYTSFVRSTITVNSGGTLTDDGSDYAVNPVNSGGTITIGGKRPKILLGAASDATNARLVMKDGHLKSTQTTAPAAAANTNAGTGATCTLSNATDVAGLLNLTTTATLPSSGIQATVTYNLPYNVAPIILLQAQSANSALNMVAQGIYVSSSTTGFDIVFNSADITGHGYNWFYHVIETQ